MSPRRGHIVRPLLDCRRADLRAYLDERSISYAVDETNSDTSIPRNRVRAELVPILESRFNPAAVDVLSNEALLAGELNAWLESQVRDLERDAVAKLSDDCRGIDVARLAASPRPLARVLLWRTMNELADRRTVTALHVAEAMRLLDEPGGRFEGPGQILERIGPRLVLKKRGKQPGERPNLFRYPLSIPGEIQLEEIGCAVSAEPLSHMEGSQERCADTGNSQERCADTGKGRSALVRADMCVQPLTVRNRRPGDRFHPVGVGGRKKLQDYFVDRKVVRASRDRVPIVVDGEERIVWVAGYGIDEAFRVTDPSQSVLLLRLRQV
jgi:tRNA(Ile)-lysidine synthase